MIKETSPPRAREQMMQAVRSASGPLAGHWALVVVVFIAAGSINSFVAPHMKLTPPMPDPALSYPVGDQQVPQAMLFGLGYIAPAVVILLVSALGDTGDFCVSLLALSQSVSLTMLVTAIAKKLAGRPRPCFYAMCKWVSNATSAPIGQEVGSCTSEKLVEWESRQSFPSGHSSFAFAGLGFLSLFLLDRLRRSGRRSSQSSSGAAPVSAWTQVQQLGALLPAGLAMWIAETRTVDFWHNYDDILAGSVLGAVIAYAAFQQRAGHYALLRDAKRGGERPGERLVPNEASSSSSDMA